MSISKRIRLATIKNSGQAAMKFILVLPLILFIIGVVIDTGWIVYNKNKIQDCADFSVLSGAQYLPLQPDRAALTAENIFRSNYGKAPKVSSVTLQDSNFGVRVYYEDTIDLFFAPILGVRNTTIIARAAASLQPIKKPGSIIPIGINKDVTINYNTVVTLWGDLLDPMRGNFGAVDPTTYKTMNPQDLEAWIANDYTGNVPSVGVLIFTKPGKMAHHVISGFNQRIAQGKTSVVCPIVDYSAVNGRSEVPVMGYAYFEVISVDGDRNNFVNITGIFRQIIDPKYITAKSTAYYGMGAVRLIE